MKTRWSILLAAMIFLGLFFRAESQGLQQAENNLPIELLYVTFDPLLDGEPLPPAELQAAPDTAYHLLQFSGPVEASWVEELKEAGITFLGYVPQYAYLVRIPAESMAAAGRHPAVRWVGPYHPAYKLSPFLSGKRLRVILFPGVSAAEAAGRWQRAGVQLEPVAAQDDTVIIEVGESAETARVAALLARDEAVRWVQNGAPLVELNDDAAGIVQSGLLDVTPLYERGLDGAGQVGAVADSGLSVYDFSGANDPNVPSCFFLDDNNSGGGGSPLIPGPTHRKVISYTIPTGASADMVDGSGHGTHVVGSLLGDRPPWNTRSSADGQAFAARVFFQDIGVGDPIGTINPPADYRVMFGEAYDPNGDSIYQPALEPRTHSNSWGAQEPIYSAESQQVDDFMWTHPDFLILYAAGNQGPAPSTVGYPATAKNIVSVGGTENGLADPNSMGYFSSHGPGPLSRLEPTISAPGDRITSALKGDPCATTEKNGTSMATPTTHGIVLLLRQYLWQGYYPSGIPTPADQIHPSAALLKALLMNSGRPIDGAHSDNGAGGSWPSNGQGWGRLLADDALYFPGDHRALWLYDEYALDGSLGFDTVGQTRVFTFTVADGRPLRPEPLEITLVWTDYPGETATGGALVNNLNLSVMGPGGIHLGNDASSNDFNGVPDLPVVMPDGINPWEGVFLNNPISGTYTVTVTAANLGSIALDPARKQGFALVVSGDLQSRRGRAEIEYTSYELPAMSSARLRVTDLDLNLNPAAIDSISVTITSTTDAAGETVLLQETGPDSSIFSGQITLTLGAPAVGELQAGDGDSLRLVYSDVDDGTGAAAEAVDRARMQALPRHYGLPPILAEPGAGLMADYTLSWSAAGDTGGLAFYQLQEAADYVQPLFDGAEGSLADKWVTQGLPNWSQDATFQSGGLRSYWSGEGDVIPLSETSLILKAPITIPLGVASAQLTFYSRYYNDLDDNGYVEISTNGGGSWQTLLRLYADPTVIPASPEMRFFELDLSSYIDMPLLIRFRFSNGILFGSPDSPGWWVDDIVISGAGWQTVATTNPGVLSHSVSGQPDGTYAYRVRAVYDNGAATAWSPVESVAVGPEPPAATIVVDSTADVSAAGDGNCTLREAVANANGNGDTTGGDCTAGSGSDTIVLPAGTFSLLSGQILLGGELTVQGAGTPRTVVDGGGLSRIFEVDGSAFVTLNDLTVINGGGVSSGGAILNQGMLTLNRCDVSGSRAENPGGDALGGGIFNGGSLTINQSVIWGNGAESTLGNGHGGGVYNSGLVMLARVTISDNTADENGGGLLNRGGTLLLSSVTVAGNAADQDNDGSGAGGGINNSSGTVTVQNSLIADNAANSGSAPDCHGTLNSGDYNWVENSAGCTLTGGSNDTTGSDPLLRPLADYGGPTLSRSLQSGSAALDAIPAAAVNCTAADSDQRGALRADGSKRGEMACDIGAFERSDTYYQQVDGPRFYFLHHAEFEVTTMGTASQFTAVYNSTHHPQATAGLMTGQYWAFTADGSGFTLSMTLPYSGTVDGGDKLCRYEGGGNWNCAADAFDTGSQTVTRYGISQLSDWAVGDDVDPTAILFRAVKSGESPVSTARWPLVVLLLALLSLITLRTKSGPVTRRPN